MLMMLLLPSPVDVDAEDSGTGMVADRSVDGLLPLTEVPKLAVKSPPDPSYACLLGGLFALSRDRD